MSRVGPTTHREKARTFGVEEEFLLVDGQTGQPMPVAEQALSRRHHPAGAVTGPALTLEVKQEQLEAVGPVCSTLQEVASAIRAGRTMADEAAMSVGARAVALGTSPLPTTPTVVPQPRYLNMAARFGLTFQEQLTCGFHVHVRIRSAEEGVAILDRIRIWLPVVLALSGNSPFWRGTDSGYASFRYQAWGRWQTAGPCERFGSAREYRRHIRSLLATGVLLDEGMVYFDARLSRSHPTVEVRIADVCLEAGHATVIAALVRALVGQAAREVAAGRPAPRVSATVLRLSSWKASSAGVDGTLVHPLLNTPRPASEVVQALLTHVHPSLAETGDDEQVTTELARLLAAGTGARRQREVMLSSQSLTAVVMDAVELTHGTRQGSRPVPGRLQSV